jgi:hypothetical protein
MKVFRYFAVHVDRDHLTNEYGDGVRMYICSNDLSDKTLNYIVVEGVTFDESNQILILEDEKGEQFKVDTEPDNIHFKNTFHNDWKKWDSIYGSQMEEDRCDYEPWAFDSLEALAVELGVHIKPGIKKYYKVE